MSVMVDRKDKRTLPDLLTFTQAAKALNISVAGVSKAVQRKKLPVVEFYHVRLIPRSALELYVESKSKGGRPRTRPR